MDPESVGHASTIVLGKHSGRAAFADALEKMSIKLEDEDFKRAFDRFKELADRKGEIGEEGLRAIVDSEAGLETGEIQLVGIHLSGGDHELPLAQVRVIHNGEQKEFEASGDGMVNAAFVALQDAFALAATLVDYRVSPITSGADAMAEVNVIIQVNADTYSGRGVSTDVVEGSARAFVAALNKAAGSGAVIS
jgi:2-isopropylmalate synthase